MEGREGEGEGEGGEEFLVKESFVAKVLDGQSE